MRTVIVDDRHPRVLPAGEGSRARRGFPDYPTRRPIAKLVPHTADKTADPEWAAAYRRMVTRLDEALPWAASESSGKNFMPVKGRFSLDTNILVYAVDRDAGERHVRSGELMARAARPTVC